MSPAASWPWRTATTPFGALAVQEALAPKLAGFAEAATGDVFSFAVILNSGGDWIDNDAAARFFAELLGILVSTTGD